MISLIALALAALPTDSLVPGKPAVLRGHSDVVMAVAFSPDGKTLASGGRDTSARLWDLSTGKETASFGANDHSQISALAWSPDGTLLAVGCIDLQVRVMDVATGSVKKAIAHPDAVQGLAFSADGKSIAVSGVNGTAIVYSVADGKLQLDLR